MVAVEDLEKRIEKIELRNKAVELNKAWETSYTRRILIAVFTYLAIALYLKYIVGIEPWVNAIVPTVGFLLSTLTLPFFKEIWGNIFIRNKKEIDHNVLQNHPCIADLFCYNGIMAEREELTFKKVNETVKRPGNVSQE